MKKNSNLLLSVAAFIGGVFGILFSQVPQIHGAGAEDFFGGYRSSLTVPYLTSFNTSTGSSLHATSTLMVNMTSGTYDYGRFRVDQDGNVSASGTIQAYGAVTVLGGCTGCSSPNFSNTALTVTDGETTSSLRADGLFVATSSLPKANANLGWFNVNASGTIHTSGTVQIITTTTVRSIYVSGGSGVPTQPFTTYGGMYINQAGAGGSQVSIEDNSGVEMGMLTANPTGYLGTWSNHPLIFRTNNTDQATLSSAGAWTMNGNVSLENQANPMLNLRSNFGGGNVFIQTIAGTDGRIGTSNNIPFEFYTNNNEVGRFTTAGEFLVNYTNSSFDKGRFSVDSSGNASASGTVRATAGAFNNAGFQFQNAVDTGLFYAGSNILSFTAGGSVMSWDGATLRPNQANTRDIGSFPLNWKDIYASGTLYANKLSINTSTASQNFAMKGDALIEGSVTTTFLGTSGGLIANASSTFNSNLQVTGALRASTTLTVGGADRTIPVGGNTASFLGTMPASPGANISGVVIDVTSAGSDNFQQTAFTALLRSGYSAGAFSYGFQGINSVGGNGGVNVGFSGYANGSGLFSRNVGMTGRAQGSGTDSIIGGYFVLSSGEANIGSISAALIADQGGVANAPIFIGRTNAAETMRIDANGWLGLGTTTLSKRLSVQGDALISGTTTLGNLSVTGTIAVSGTLYMGKGPDIASANNVTLSNSGNMHEITGTTQINCINAGHVTKGTVETLVFQGNVTVAHNQACTAPNERLFLSGAANFAATASDTLYIQYGGGWWTEIARSAI